MYNKRKFNKINNKKVLHKVKKQWIIVSLALFMMISGGAISTHINVFASTNNLHKVNTNLGNEDNKVTSIDNHAKLMHHNLLNNVVIKKNTNKSRTYKATSHPLVNNYPTKRITNINDLKNNQAGDYHDRVYKHINIPFKHIKASKPIRMYSSINFNHKNVIGTLPKGQIVKVNKAFKEFGYFHNYLRYEICSSYKRNAFITGNRNYVSYIAPTKNYKYYRTRINRLLKSTNKRYSNKLVKRLNKLNKQRKHNINKYVNLYELSYNAQQNYKHPVIVNYHNEIAKINNYHFIKRNHYHNNSIHKVNIAPKTSINSSNVNNSSRLNNANIEIISSNTSVTPTVASSLVSNDAFANPINSSTVFVPSTSISSNIISSSAQSNAESSVNSNSVNASNMSNSSASSATNIIHGFYRGLNYEYDPIKKVAEFVNGTANPNLSDFILQAPQSIKNANHIKFDNNVNISRVANMNSMFQNDLNLQTLDFGDNFDTSSVIGMFNMFYNDSNLTTLNLGNKFNTHKVNNMWGMFGNNPKLKSLNLGNHFDTSNVTAMAGMFMNDTSLISLNFGDKFNTNKVTNMSGLFKNDELLQDLNLGNNFDTSQVTNMYDMFYNMPSLNTLNFGSQFNTDKVINMSDMFYNNDLHKIEIQSPNTKFNKNSKLSNSLYKQLSNNVFSDTSVTLNNNQSHVGVFLPGYIAHMINNPNELVAKKNPSLVSNIYQQNYHFNNPMGQSNDIESILPHYQNGNLNYWDIYYLWNPIDNEIMSDGQFLPTDQWGHVVTKDFKKFNFIDYDNSLSLKNVAIPDPEYEINDVSHIEVLSGNKINNIPWGQVAGGSVINNKKIDGSTWISKDQWGNPISPDARLAFFATYRSKPMINGENTGNYLAYANPDGNGGYQQFRPFSFNDVFDSTTLGKQPNQDGRDPFVTVNPNNSNQLIAYLAGGSTHKIFELVSSDAINWHNANNDIDLTSVMNKSGFTNPMSVETPHINVINNQPILTFSAQDMSTTSNPIAEKKQGVFYVTGDFNNNGLFQLDNNPKFGAIDYGFDNYAGNFANLDSNHLIYIGWLGNWYTFDGPHDGGFSLPRILTWDGNRLNSVPINPGNLVNSGSTDNEYQPDGMVEMNLADQSNGEIQFTRSNATPDNVIAVSFANGLFTVTRNDGVNGETNMSRTIKLPVKQLSKIDFYLDNDSVEIYLPDVHQMFSMLDFSNKRNSPYILKKNSNNSVVNFYKFNN